MQFIRRSLSGALIACALLGVVALRTTAVHASPVRAYAEPSSPHPLAPSIPPSSSGEPDGGSTKSVAQKNAPLATSLSVSALWSRAELRWLAIASLGRFLGMGL